MDNDEMSDIFKSWNEGELDSFLIEISTNILKYRDESGEFLLEKIRDSAGQKGTGTKGFIIQKSQTDVFEYNTPIEVHKQFQSLKSFDLRLRIVNLRSSISITVNFLQENGQQYQLWSMVCQ